MTKWFYQTDQNIKGPVTTAELKNLIPQLSDARQTFVWSRGHTEWISADRWQPNHEIVEDFSDDSPSLNLKTQPTVQPPMTELTATGFIPDPLSETTHVPMTENAIHQKPTLAPITTTDHPSISTEEKFRVQLNFIDQPPMTKDELMNFAARVDDPAQVAIFDPQTKEWKEIYAFKDIVEKLGLTRRKHPRVPILAQFTGSTSRHEKFSARLVTISIGGLGITDIFDLNIGDIISGQITSPHFYSPVTIEAEATYCGNDGYVGLKFTQINDDSQSLVTDYVKRFS